MGWHSDFADGKRFRFTIDPSLIDADLTNFPVRVVIKAQSGIEKADLTQIIKELGTSNLKLAATTSDGETECYVEIERWDTTNNIGVLNIKLPSVSSSVDTVFFLYWDPGISDNSTYVGVVGSTPGQAVWDDDFLMVFHMDEDPTGGAECIKDSTGYADGTPGGTMTAGDLVTSMAGAQGLDMDGSDDQVLAQNPVGDMTGEFTMEVFAKLDNITSSRSMLNSRQDNNNLWFFGLYNPGTLYLYHRYSGSTQISVSSDGSLLDTDNYNLMTCRRDAAGLITFGCGANQDAGGGTDTSTINEQQTTLDIGGEAQTASLYDNVDGIISEVRISNDSCRSEAWLKATHYALSDTLITASIREDWLPGFNNRIDVTIDSDLIDATLSEFPVMLHIAEGAGITPADLTRIFSIVGKDGNSKKIAVTTSDGLTQCPVEIEQWDTDNQVAILHAKVPSISSSADTVLYFYFDGSVEDNIEFVGDIGDEAAIAVWDSDFEAVYHLNQDPSGGAGCMLDSTGTYDADPGAGLAAGNLVDADIGKGIQLDGVDDGNEYVDANFYLSGDQTLECYCKCTDFASHRNTFMGSGHGSANGTYFEFYSATELLIGTYDGSWRRAYYSYPTGFSTSTWYHVVGTMDKLNGTADYELWLDGVSVATNAADNYAPGLYNMFIGAWWDNNNSKDTMNFEGTIREVRISSIVRSDAWIKATNHTLKDTLVTWGNYETQEFKKYRNFSIANALIDSDLTDFPIALPLSTSAGTNNADLSGLFAELAYPGDDQFDGIDGNDLDTNRWDIVTASCINGALSSNQYRFNSSEGSDESHQVYSNFRLTGDFDVQIDLNINNATTPSGSNHTVGRFDIRDAKSGYSVYSQILLQKLTAGTLRFAVQGTSTGWTTDTETEYDTKFRITRSGSVIKTYYWKASTGQWEWNGSTSGKTMSETSTADMHINFGSTQSGGQNLDVSWDNFTINSGSIVWPDGEPNRKKIKVTTGDLETQCYVEIEHLDCTNEVGMLHVKVPHVDASVNTEIYLHYDSDQPDNDTYVGDPGSTVAQNVWDQNFIAVYHLAEDPSGGADAVKDSTSKENHLTSTGSMTTSDLIDSQPGKGIDFDGSNDGLYKTGATDIPTAYPATLEVAGPAKVTAAANTNPQIGITDGSSPDDMTNLYIYNGYARLNHYTGGNNIADGTLQLTDGVFCHLAGVYTNSTDRAVITNGSNKVTDTASDAWVSGSATKICVGYVGDSTPGYRAGEVSEARISDVARSDAWIKATYYTLSDAIGAWGDAESTWLGTFQYRRKVTVDKDVIDGLLKNFPMAFAVSSSAGIGGSDISGIFDRIATSAAKRMAVTARDGRNQLFVEIENWDSTGDVGIIHIKAPELFFNKDTEFYIYYDSNQDENTDWVGDPGDTPAMAVWDPDFLGVWHMADLTTSTIQESTSNNHTSTKGSASNPTETDGLNGKGQEFDATSEQISVGDIDIDGPGTVEAVVNPDTLSAVMSILSKINSGGANSYFDFSLRVNASGQVQIETGDTSSQQTFNATSLTLSTATWQYVAGKADGSNLKAFLDAASESVAQTVTPAGNAEPYEIGNTPYYTQAFDGIIDEVRMSSVARSDAWIAATYAALFDALVTWSAEESQEAAADVTVEVGTPSITYTVQTAAVGVSVIVGTPSINYQVQPAGAGIGADAGTPNFSYSVLPVSIVQNFKAIGIMSKPTVTGKGPGATATGRQPGATATGAGPTANVTGKGE